MKKWAIPLALSFALLASVSHAQTYSKGNVGIARGVSPNLIGVDVGSASASFLSFASVSGGVVSITAPSAYYGAGAVYAATANFTGSISAAGSVGVLGSVATPDTTQNPVAVWQKTTGSTATSGVNQTTYTSIVKRMSAANTRATAGFDEAHDPVGGSGSFAEGRRMHCVLVGGTGGGCYGFVAVAGTGTGQSYKYLVGGEGSVENYSGTDSLTWVSFDPAHFAASFVSTNVTAAGTSMAKSDVGFVNNPHSSKPFRTGFGCIGDIGGGLVGVDDSCFAAKGSVPYGLNLVNGTYSSAAIVLPNLGIVRARNAAANADLNVAYLDGSNQWVVGTDAVAILNQKPVVNSSYQRATAFISNGSAPTITGSGSCTLGTQVGGSTAGKFTATAACAAGQTYTISGMPASVNGYACDLIDRTTAGVVFQQTSDSTTSAVLTVRSVGVANADVIQFKCTGY